MDVDVDVDVAVEVAVIVEDGADEEVVVEQEATSASVSTRQARAVTNAAAS